MKSKNRLVLICAIALVMTIAVGATLAYFYGEDQKVNKFTTAGETDAPSPTITEPEWTEKPTDDPDFPGDIRPKDPTLVNKGGEGYGRVVVELIDKATGARITDPARAKLIMDMIIYTTEDLESPRDSMKLEKVNTYPDFNETLFEKDDVRSTTGRTFYNLKEIMKKDGRAVLFTYVVLPTDYEAEEMELMGDFNIVITGQMIQTKNLTKDEALAEMDAKLAAPAPSPSPTATTSASPSPSASPSTTP